MLFHNQQKSMIFFHATKFLLIFSLALCSFCACNSNKSGSKDLEADPQQGTLRLFVDETFEPIISQQIMVFESSFPKAHIIVKYEPEADCFRDFEKDSTNMIIVARGLKEDESKYYNSKLGHRPRFSIIAFDAVSMIINANASDSVFSLKELNKLLTSNDKQPYQVILDGENATSTVRYLLDSITHGKSFGNNVSGAKGSKQVIDLIASNKNAVGFVGSSWVGNADDPEQLAYFNKVHLAYVECKIPDSTGVFARPSQSTIYNMQYPLVRPLYCVLKDNYIGLGTSFYNFLSFQRGQLIFRRGNLVPAKMNFTIRTVNDFATKKK